MLKRAQLEMELRLIVDEISRLQRHIKAGKVVLRSCIREESKLRVNEELTKARDRIEFLEVKRDRLRDEIEGLDFKG